MAKRKRCDDSAMEDSRSTIRGELTPELSRACDAAARSSNDCSPPVVLQSFDSKLNAGIRSSHFRRPPYPEGKKKYMSDTKDKSSEIVPRYSYENVRGYTGKITDNQLCGHPLRSYPSML